jgi:hypothetical protein
VPVALTISKSDLLDPLVDPSMRFLREASLDDWVQDQEATSDEIREMLLAMGEVALVHVADSYGADDRRAVMYHAVSALGGGPDDVARYGAMPRRCADPFGSVLRRLVYYLD